MAMSYTPNGVSGSYTQAADHSRAKQQFAQQMGAGGPTMQDRLRWTDGLTRGRPPAEAPEAPSTLQVPDLSAPVAPQTQMQQPSPQAAGGGQERDETLPGVTKGKGTGAKALRKAIMQQAARNAKLGAGYLPDFLEQLSRQAQTFDPYSLGVQHAGDYERLNDFFNQAQGRLDQTLAARGLTDSSYGGAAFGQLAGQQAQATSGLTQNLYETADQRQRMAQAQLGDYISSMFGQNAGLTGNLAGAITADQLAQAQLDAQSGFDFGGFLNSALGAAGTAYGGYLGRPR